jgi:hypothetical protein
MNTAFGERLKQISQLRTAMLFHEPRRSASCRAGRTARRRSAGSSEEVSEPERHIAQLNHNARAYDASRHNVAPVEIGFKSLFSAGHRLDNR